MLRSVRMLGVVLALGMSCVGLSAEEEKTKEAEAGELKLQVPESWKAPEQLKTFRIAEFAVPARKGEKETDGEYVVFHFGPEGGGGIDDNLARWVNMFDEKGREMKVTQGESSQGKYVILELSGTYNKSVGPPFLRKTEKVPDSRGLFVILSSKGSGNYFIRLTGADGLVKSQAETFRKSFGGDGSKEEEYKTK